jgi:hypothetical protein
VSLAIPRFAHYIRPRKAKEADMSWRIPENASVCFDEAGIVPVMGLPPKDPNDDDDENEEDDEDDEDEQEEEPAVIRDDE